MSEFQASNSQKHPHKAMGSTSLKVAGAKPPLKPRKPVRFKKKPGTATAHNPGAKTP